MLFYYVIVISAYYEPINHLANIEFLWPWEFFAMEEKSVLFFVHSSVLFLFVYFLFFKSNLSCCVSLSCAGHLMMEHVGYGMLGIRS